MKEKFLQHKTLYQWNEMREFSLPQQKCFPCLPWIPSHSHWLLLSDRGASTRHKYSTEHLLGCYTLVTWNGVYLTKVIVRIGCLLGRMNTGCGRTGSSKRHKIPLGSLEIKFLEIKIKFISAFVSFLKLVYWNLDHSKVDDSWSASKCIKMSLFYALGI